MLAKWSTLDPDQYTWSTIIGALETPSIGEVALAAELRTKYMYLCPLSLNSVPSIPHLMDKVPAVIPHTVGPTSARLDGKMVPSFSCLIPIVCPIPTVGTLFCVCYLNLA